MIETTPKIEASIKEGSEKKQKLALALIVKGIDSEAEFLDRCLTNLEDYVDGIFITITHLPGEKPNNKVFEVCVKHRAFVSYFEWVKDFSKARNYNFSQVPREYEYIMWCDADDVFRGQENLRSIIEAHKAVDAFAFNYLYAFDEYNNPIVVHKKTQIIRNDGCASWVGYIHEDLIENRAINVQFIGSIERMHLTTDERTIDSKYRNVEISKSEAEEKPNDPRSYFNLGNSYFGAAKFKEAKEAYHTFIEMTGSQDEKYIAMQRLSSVENALGNKEEAIMYLQISIGMFPDIPDSYNYLGYLYFDYGDLDEAERYLLKGLVTKPQYHKMIAYNPREYDYQPMLALAKVYFKKNRADLALPLLKGCAEIYPTSEFIGGLVKEMEAETKRMGLVIEAIKKIETFGDDKDKIANEINGLPSDLQSHPAICRVRNKYFVKEFSSGKDIAYYCGETIHTWNPEMAKTKGIGGSEEAVINLAKQWTKSGYNVTVFCSCGEVPMVCDGVTYKPWWHYNHLDRYDITILWRSPALAEHPLNTGKIFVDLHDVIPAGEFTEKRLAKIDKIFVKTKSHRILFPKVPDNKFAIIPNGQDPLLFSEDIKKDPMLLVNTSSPDRSLDALVEMFREVKKQVPKAKLKWAYGWEIFDNAHSKDKTMMAWKEKIVKAMEDTGVENMGRLSQKECAKLYKEGRIFAYPTEFYEIDCISVKKAQACGCFPITTDFAALAESNQHGIKIHSTKNKDNWCKPYQFTFGLEDKTARKQWIDAVVKELKSPMRDTSEMELWAIQFEWEIIAKRWSEQF